VPSPGIIGRTRKKRKRKTLQLREAGAEQY
jgi:hypothetical protein